MPAGLVSPKASLLGLQTTTSFLCFHKVLSLITHTPWVSCSYKNTNHIRLGSHTMTSLSCSHLFEDFISKYGYIQRYRGWDSNIWILREYKPAHKKDKRSGYWAKAWEVTSGSWQRQGHGFYPRASGRTAALWHLGSSSVETIKLTELYVINLF